MFHKFMKFCPDDYMLIENYELALADNFKDWICHHINGETTTRETLLELGLYYNVPYYMLKFVTREEHNRIHNNLAKYIKVNGNPNKGKHFSQDTKNKMSQGRIGNTNAKGHTLSVEKRIKHSKLLKGKHWKVIDGRRVWY